MSKIHRIIKRLDQLETMLIEQEHRAFPLFRNLWRFCRVPDARRRAAVWAVVYRLLGTSLVVGGAGLAVWLGVLFAYSQSSSLKQQNKLLDEQNTLLRSQSELARRQLELTMTQTQQLEAQLQLSEAQRRAGLSFELANIMELVSRIRATHVSSSQPSVREMLQTTGVIAGFHRATPPFELDDELIGRVIAFTYAAKPYRYLDAEEGNGLLMHAPLSPERGYLFVYLVNAGVDMGALFAAKPDFSCSDLRNAYLNGVDLTFAPLKGANLQGAYVGGANLSAADIRNTVWDEGSLHKSNVSRARVSGASLRNTLLTGVDFTDSCLLDVDLEGAIVGYDEKPRLPLPELFGRNVRGFDKDRWLIVNEEDDNGVLAWRVRSREQTTGLMPASPSAP